MLNIQLTSDAGSRPNSFAGNGKSGPTAARSLSWENLIYIADFLWTSGRRQVSLAEGELTVHPQCLDFILYLLDRGFHVTFFIAGFGNSSYAEEFERHLNGTPIERLTMVCHFQDPAQFQAPPSGTDGLHHFLRVMGPWTQAGFKIDRLNFTLDFLFDLIDRFRLQPHLHLSLAHPSPGKRDGFILAEEKRRVVARLYAHRQLFEAHRVLPHLDCGWPLCHFSDAELGWLYRGGGSAPFGCGPALHISPDLVVSHCLPLANYSGKSLFEFDSLEQIGQYFARRRAEIETEADIYAQCAGCRCREAGVCRGEALCRTAGRGLDRARPGLGGGEDEISTYRLP